MTTESDLPILYLLDSSVAITGAFICARNEAEQLKGVARVRLVLPSESRIAEDQLEPFEQVLRLPLVNLRRSVRSFVLYMPMLVYCAWRLYRHMRADRAEHLQLNDFYLMQGAMCRLFGYRGRIVSWIRFDPRRFGRVLSGLWLFVASRTSNRIVAVSRFIQGVVPNIETVLLYDSLVHPASPQGVSDVVSDRRTRRLVYVGNYIDGKGQDDAIAAFAAVAEAFPDLVLEFYGGDMGLEKNRVYRKGLEDSVRRLGLERRVRFGGFVDHTAEVLKGAFVGINFSRSESFSMTVLEAADAGLPVIATRSGGPQEIVEDGVTGFLVPVRDIPAMSAAIAALARDTARASAMGEAGRRLARQRFSSEAHLSGLMDIFDLHRGCVS